MTRQNIAAKILSSGRFAKKNKTKEICQNLAKTNFGQTKIKNKKTKIENDLLKNYFRKNLTGISCIFCFAIPKYTKATRFLHFFTYNYCNHQQRLSGVVKTKINFSVCSASFYRDWFDRSSIIFYFCFFQWDFVM